MTLVSITTIYSLTLVSITTIYSMTLVSITTIYSMTLVSITTIYSITLVSITTIYSMTLVSITTIYSITLVSITTIYSTLSLCVTRIGLGLMINAGMLLASSRRLIFGGPVISLGLTGKSLFAVKWELMKPTLRPSVSIVTEIGLFLWMSSPS